jgi:hypothetical protein
MKAIVYVIWAFVNAVTITLYMSSVFLFVVYTMDALQQAIAKR